MERPTPTPPPFSGLLPTVLACVATGFIVALGVSLVLTYLLG